MVQGFTHESTHNESEEWYTPRRIFEAMGVEFDLDPCSPGAETVPWIPATRHLTYFENGLRIKWFGNVWLNPPYGQDAGKWLRKLAIHGRGIALVFSRTDTQWFHKYVPMADAVCFVKGRVQFVKASEASRYAAGGYTPKGGCGAGSMLVAFGEDNAEILYRCGLGLALSVGGQITSDNNNTGGLFALTQKGAMK
ncbi:MAG: DNA N-6-adenine-methyltransferase [Planctomycetota bacterium]|jgi:hypothetical protein